MNYENPYRKKNYENPYRKKQPQAAPPETTMGPQSQRRISLVGRTHRMQITLAQGRNQGREIN
jgi:hypothetical protein